MAVKLAKNGSCFPTRIQDGVLAYSFGGDTFLFDFNWCPYNFPVSDTYWEASSIALKCYNPETNILLIGRYDGSFTLYRNNIVIGKTNRELPKIPNSYIALEKYCMIVRDIDVKATAENESGSVFGCTLYVKKDGSKVIIDSAAYLGYFVIYHSGQNERFFEDINSAIKFYPKLTVVNLQEHCIIRRLGDDGFDIHAEYHAPEDSKLENEEDADGS